MNKIISIFIALFLAFAMSFTMAAPASATAAVAEQRTVPGVSSTYECNEKTGKFDVTWVVTGDPDYPDVAGTIVSEDRNVNPTFVGRTVQGASTQTAVERGLEGGEYQLTIAVQFDNHAEGDVVENFDLVITEGECVKDEPEKASVRLVKYDSCGWKNDVVKVEGRHNVEKVSLNRVGHTKWVFNAKAKDGAKFANGTNRVHRVVRTTLEKNCGFGSG